MRLDIQGIEKWSLLAVTRFALAFIVAIGHLEQQVPLGALAVVPMFGPFEAVLGFLLISGYSIGSSYAREREGFLKRRALRIYPVYLGAILLTWLATPHAFDITFATTLLQNVLFLNQITTATSYVGPAWSLALEVWLYCLTPWLWRMQTNHLRAVMYLSCVAFCGFELARSAFHLPYYAGLAWGLNLPLLSFPWLAGLLLAREPKLARRTLVDCLLMFSAQVALAAAIPALHAWRHGDTSELIAEIPECLTRAMTIAAVLLVFRWIVVGRAGTTRYPSLRLLGDLSYPLYLVHVAVFAIASGLGMRNSLLLTGAALVASLLFYWTLDFYSHARERTARPLPGLTQFPSPLARPAHARNTTRR